MLTSDDRMKSILQRQNYFTDELRKREWTSAQEIEQIAYLKREALPAWLKKKRVIEKFVGHVNLAMKSNRVELFMLSGEARVAQVGGLSIYFGPSVSAKTTATLRTCSVCVQPNGQADVKIGTMVASPVKAYKLNIFSSSDDAFEGVVLDFIDANTPSLYDH